MFPSIRKASVRGETGRVTPVSESMLTSGPFATAKLNTGSATPLTVSCEILTGAAESLAQLAASVLQKLDMQNRNIIIAKSGGALGRSKFFDAAIDSNLAGLAPQAQIVALQMKPAEAAARMAIHLPKRKGHTG